MAPAPLRLDNPEAAARIDQLFGEIEARGVEHLESDGFPPEKIDIRRSLDMRYVGQVHECTVDIGNFVIDEASIEKVKDAFHARHEELYTYAERHSAVEVVNIEATIYGRIDKPKAPRLAAGSSADEALKGHREAVFESSGTATHTPIYDGSKLGAGSVVAGPAIVEEVTTTIVIEPGWTARLDESGSYVLTREKDRA